MKTYYNYDPKTGEYLSDYVPDISPLDKTYLVMAFSTPKQPPTVSTNQRAVFLDVDGKAPNLSINGAWKTIKDFRGEKYWLEDGSYHTITAIGQDFPENAFRTQPPTPIDVLRDKKWGDIKSERDKFEYGPFAWNSHLFDGDIKSQQRILLAIVSASANPSISVDWRLANNDLITLSSSDIKEVGAAMAMHIEEAFSHANTLKVLIEMATTQTELDDIVW